MTPKQTRFVEEYLIDLNATQAAIRAGYSPNCAGIQGHENLKKPNIATAIAAAKLERSQRTQVDADWVIQALLDDRALAYETRNASAATAAAVWIGKHLLMWPTRITITDADRDAARVVAAQLGLDEAEVLAEVERELKEARG